MPDLTIVETTLEERRAAFDRTIEAARRIMLENLAGNVVKDYNVWEDETVWVFGPHVFKRLKAKVTGRSFPDDPTPFVLGRDTVPLTEFRDYLEAWYWPKQNAGETE